MSAYVPPRDAYEFQVAMTAGRVLRRDDVGALDDLRAFGLDEERAVQLALQLRRLVGRRVAPADVLERHTVERVAAACRTGPKNGRWSSLVTIRQAAAGIPLVLVHPIGGNAFWYLDLCRRLTGDRTLLALHARGLDLAEAPHTEIISMADAYVSELLEALPDRVCAIAGWSFGGLVAFEMARKLTSIGYGVPLLTMLDIGPANAGQWPAHEEMAIVLLLNACGLAREAHEVLALSSEERMPAILRRAKARRALPEGWGGRELDRMFQLNLHNLRAAERWRPGRYDGDMLVFVSGATAASVETLGWDAVTSGAIRTHPLPGNHFEALARANLPMIASRLDAEFAKLV